MKMIFNVVAVLGLFASANAFAASGIDDAKILSSCGGVVELRQDAQDDLAIQFKGMTGCDRLVFSDVTSGRTIKSYDVKGTSYTLSKSMRASLSDDCRVAFTLSGPYGRRDAFQIVLPWCAAPAPTPGPASTGKSYQLSEKGNCKLMIWGQYSNKLVADSFCSGATSKNDIVTFEQSRNGNCKHMVNGTYTNQNVSQAYCE